MRLVRYLLILIVLVIPLGQFTRLPLGGETVNVYFGDILVSLIVIVYFVYNFAVRKQFHIPPLGGLITLFLSIAIITLLNGMKFINMQQWVVSMLYLIRFASYAYIYFITYDFLVTSPPNQAERDAIKLIKLLMLSGLLLALFGFVQLKIFPDFSKLDPALGWDPHNNRLVSTFFDPNFLAAYLVLTLCLVASLVLIKVKYFSLRWLVCNLMIIFSALILTFSRSGYLMFAIAVAVLGILKSRKLLLISLIAFLVATFMIPRVQTRIAGGVDPDDSAKFRFISWKNTLKIIKDHPVSGVGFNAFRYAQQRYGFIDYSDPTGGRAGAGSDSSLLFVWTTTGIFGLAVFLLILFKVGLLAFRNFINKDSMPLLKVLSLTLVAGGVSILAQSNFINSLFYPWIMLWLWIIVAIFMASKEFYEAEN